MSALAFLPSYTWHPLGQCAGTAAEVSRCRSYNLWSGIVSDVSEITLIFAVLGVGWRAYRLWRRHTECHVADCSRHGYPVHGTPYRACHPHHPATSHAAGQRITPAHILDAHARHVEALRSGP